jgi:hypothetical protein
MFAPNCPHCGKAITLNRAGLHALELTDNRLSVRAFAAVCPNLDCKKVLGVIADPIPQDSMLAKIMKALRIS